MGVCKTLRNAHVASYTGIKTPRRPKGGEKKLGISDPQYRGLGVEGLTMFIKLQLVHPYGGYSTLDYIVFELYE